ncbi:hypothetical protein FB567DRAFT_445195 [Paraphoma chrysanthemicola]|uniref:Nuclear pore complex NUP2/50/61 domain-containing protein n=1 Tax=Paraphoma chrysanthemicola TaxID=798071 RepID=A0A8K0R2G2_9PLEO|nr:hypothetical protein FB567DRAFT_445195 [Paraphoma chrysanthemicola]
MSGKRANVFGQGRPEEPYQERDDPAEVPQRATAAQLATRKYDQDCQNTAACRSLSEYLPSDDAPSTRGAMSARYNTAAGRRDIRRRHEAQQRQQEANARMQTPSQSANFSTPQGGFSFGASAPAVGGNNNNNNTANGIFGGGSNAFGGASTNSFPPAQSAAPSNSFTNSSFPAFGGGNQGTGFNPQPPSATDFNFTAGAAPANPFQSNGAPAMNGNGATPAFGGGSTFGSQSSGNLFGGLAQTNTTSAAGSGSLFGTTSGAPSTNLFGTSSIAPPTNLFGTANPTSSAPTPSFTFGATTSTAQNTASTPATSNVFGGFGGSSQSTAAPAENSLFSGFGANGQNGVAPQQATQQKSLFSTGTSAQNVGSTPATAPSSNLFGFTSTAQPSTTATTTAPSSNLFGASSTPASAPASNPFASLPTSSGSTTPTFSFGQQTAPAQDKAPGNPFGGLNVKAPEQNVETPKPSLFSSVKAPEPSASASSGTPTPNLFASLAKPPPAAGSPAFSMFGVSQNKDTAPAATEQPATSGPTPSEAPRPNLFTGFSTPQPTKTAEAEKPKAGLFSAQPKTNSGLFSQTFQPENHNTGNAFKTGPSFSAPKSQPAPAKPPQETSAQSAPAAESSNPFAKLSTPSTDRPSLFAPSNERTFAPGPAAVPTPVGGSTSSAQATAGTELPKIPKVHIPQEWKAPGITSTQQHDGLYNLISNLTLQLQQLNEKYRAKISSLSTTADWSSLSLWHHQHSSAIKKKIDIAKKQRAAANGVTGNESTLSTKRKVNDESPENRNASPTKRSRPTEPPTTPTPQPSTSAPKFNPPPATATSALFSKAINKSSAPSESTNMFAQQAAAEKPAAEPVKFTPSTANAVPGFKPFSGVASPFTPSAFTASNSSAPSGGFKPSTAGSSSGFASQFAAKAKTYEELAKERKKKAMEEDYDSDDETEEEWSAKYDKQEAERIAKEKAAAAAVTGFSLPAAAPAKPTGSYSAPAPFASLAKPTASGFSTPGLATSRPASPALSTGGQSVFDVPSTAQTPSSNIFGHLSSGPSSSNQDESDEDASHDAAYANNRPSTPPKRKFGDSETDEETAKHKKQDSAPKGSLLSRMTRDDDESGSEKENNGSIFGKVNGTQTPSFPKFDFSAAAGANTAPPKSSSDTFAGDQTFKPGTPIKFGGVAATEKKAAPSFSFSTASTSTTPSKPPPTNLFNFGNAGSSSGFLTPSGGLSGLNSVPSSTFTSRAATPLSEAENSAASGAEDDEDGGRHEQVDLSKLTDEEVNAFDVVFETEQALAKHQVDKGDGTKAWENFARGPLYILKDKVTKKCFVRIRIPSGQTPLNYSILPALKSSIMGSSGKMVQGSKPKKEGGIEQYYISLKTPELAKEFSDKYNESLPS